MARDISNEFKFVHIETGRLFRKMINEESGYGPKLKKYILNGKLVPDDLACEIVEEEIEKNIHQKGIIFDGFPRTLEQAKFLDEKLSQKSTSLQMAFLLKIKENIAVERSLKKMQSMNQASLDKKKERIEERIEEQRKHLKELRKHYNRQNKLFEYDASTSPDSVQWGIRKIVMRNIEV